MKRVIIICFSISLVLIVSGCHEAEKRAGHIYQGLEKSAEIEKEFAEQHVASVKASQEEQSLYKEIISLEMDQEEQIKQNTRDAQELNTKEKQYLYESKKKFDQAYETFSEIKSPVSHIKHIKVKEQATTVIELMEKRRELFESYYDHYLEVIKLNGQFYEQLQNEELKVSEMSQQIKKINANYLAMKEKQQQFNQNTKQYNKVKSKYYQNEVMVKKKV
ncbi:MAG: YkyA family protein [Anaerobacillus sp.]